MQGDGAPGMALCDGLGCDGFAWKYLLPELRKDARVVRWHYRGHGRSPMARNPGSIGIEHCCNDLEAVLDAAGLERAVIFGHSMGVQIALEFHRRYRPRVAGLVLLCGSYGNPLDTFHDHTRLKWIFPYFRAAVEARPRLAKTITGIAMSTELAMQVAMRVELNPELMKRADLVPYFDHLAHMDPVAFVRTLDSLKDHSAWDHLPHVDVPTLVVGGERDKFTPVWLSRRMADAIPGAEFLLVPGGSHTAPLEQPALIGRHIERFLQARIRGARVATTGAVAASREPVPSQVSGA